MSPDPLGSLRLQRSTKFHVRCFEKYIRYFRKLSETLLTVIFYVN